MAKNAIEKSPLAKVLDAWYRGRAWFPLVRSPTLPVPDRLVLSALLSRKRNGLRSNPSALRRETGLDRNETIPGALRELRDDYEVIDWDEEKGLIKSKEPNELEGRFHLRDCPNPGVWSDRVAYDRYYLLAEKSPLTTADNVILWTLAGRSRDGYSVIGQNRQGISSMTGYSTRHVGRVVAKLRKLGFVEEYSARSWGLNPPDADRLAMFRELTPVARDLAAGARLDANSRKIPEKPGPTYSIRAWKTT